MDLTDNACEFIEQEKSELNYESVVIIFERIYHG